MNAYAIPKHRTPRQRLRAHEADPNLRHTAARWLAHEAVHPGKGAAELAATYDDTTAIAEIEAAVVDFRAKVPRSEELAYLEWLLAELRPDTRPAQLELAA